jgi:hypothetical protein
MSCYAIDRLTMQFLRRTQAGAVYGNEGQGAPWELQIEICSDGRIHCRLRLARKNLNAHEKVDQLRFQQALATSKNIRLIDSRTGFDLAANTTIQMSGIEAPEPKWIAFIEKVADIQHLSRIVIPIPDRTISAEEVKLVVDAHYIVTQGDVELRGVFGLRVDQNFASEVIGIHERDEHFAVTQALGPEALRVLDQEIDLGMSVLYGEKIVPTPQCVAALRATAPAQDEPFVELELVAKEGAAFRRLFPKWMKPGMQLPPEAEKRLEGLKRHLANSDTR